MRRLAKFQGLTGLQRRIFLRAIIALPLVALGLRLAGLRRVQALLAHVPARTRGDAKDIARLVAAAARHGPWTGNCLETSLTLQWILRSHGIDSDLRLGVRKAGAQIEAHAWLERGGAPLIEAAGDAANFMAFDRVIYPPARASR